MFTSLSSASRIAAHAQLSHAHAPFRKRLVKTHPKTHVISDLDKQKRFLTDWIKDTSKAKNLVSNPFGKFFNGLAI